MSTDRRLSSFGGTKSSRKDSRPISDKAFQQAAQAKVSALSKIMFLTIFALCFFNCFYLIEANIFSVNI